MTNYKKTPEPHYYIGKKYKYSARKIIEDFDLSYNCGTALSYILRSGKKEGNPASQDIIKAINHLKFELDKLDESKDTKTGGLVR